MLTVEITQTSPSARDKSKSLTKQTNQGGNIKWCQDEPSIQSVLYQFVIAVIYLLKKYESITVVIQLSKSILLAPESLSSSVSPPTP